MHNTLAIAFGEVKGWLFTPRAVLGFLLGGVLYAGPALRYAALVEALGGQGNIAEPFIIFGSTPQLYTFSLLGLLLLLSNAPFVTEQTPYVMLRTSKGTWLTAQIVYVVAAALLYYLFLFLITAAVTIRNGHLEAFWSKPFLLLSKQSPQYLISRYQISFRFPDFSDQLSPLQAFFATWAYNSLYGISLGLCLFTFNAWGKGQWGWGAVVFLHITGYLVIMNGPGVFPLKLSLLLYAMPAFNQWGPPYQGPFESCLVLFGVNTLLGAVCFLRMRKQDLRGI